MVTGVMHILSEIIEVSLAVDEEVLAERWSRKMLGPALACLRCQRCYLATFDCRTFPAQYSSGFRKRINGCCTFCGFPREEQSDAMAKLSPMWNTVPDEAWRFRLCNLRGV